MGLFSKKNHTLAIIGNGFDLNHGYRTDYKSFVNSTDHPDLQKFRDFCEKEADITTWFSFEENISILSEKIFRRSVSDAANSDFDFDTNRKELSELNSAFQGIHTLLGDYLTRETLTHRLERKQSIQKYLNQGAVALNFNYTKTAEEYTKNVIYVHGSLEEQNILLGFDFRYIGCLEQFEDMRWSKDICREILAFHRHFRKRLSPKSGRFKKLLSGLEAYLHWENTGRGLDDEVKEFIPKYSVVHRFLKKYRAKGEIPFICYENIDTIAVLGHGIEADKVFLQRLLEKCVSLKEVVIYSYEGESDLEFNTKASFFAPYCEKITKTYY